MATVAEEPQVLSIRDRIAALNQAKVGLNPNTDSPDRPGPEPAQRRPQPPPPPSKPPRRSVNNVEPVPSYSSVDNDPPAEEKVLRPPPIPSVKTTSDTAVPVTNGKPKAPPPLPSRKKSTQNLAPPRLPTRRPSTDSFQRRNSQESVTSDASFSTTSTRRTAGTSSTSIDSGPGRTLRAPAWNEAELPPLPPKRETPPQQPPRPKSSGGKSIDSISSKLSLSSVKAPPLPRRDTSGSNVSNGSRPIPRPPPRPSANSYSSERSANTEEPAPSLPARRLPPPPTADGLSKIRQSGFGGLTSRNATPEPSGVPPPIPQSSRPDMSKLLATKPRMPASNATAVAAPAPVHAGCLKCRDFSAPDAHAARYPRETLPTHDLAWLAHELTAPFPSATDKARVIFTWLHHNILYDVVSYFNNTVKPSTPAQVFATGLAVCEGYADLLMTLAKHAGLEAIKIGGNGKGFGYKPLAPGERPPPRKATGHAWNAVKIDNGEWKLMDPCWGAGNCQGPGQPYEKNFKPNNFTESNVEFGIRHFPEDSRYFFREDGRPSISWEEYVLETGVEKPFTFNDVHKYNIGEHSFLPAAKRISVAQAVPVRFQFRLVCDHWSIERHGRTKPSLFVLFIRGIDGQKEERLLFNHIRGPDPNAGGDVWYVDVMDSRILGTPGQKAQLAVITTFGDRDGAGVTAEEYNRGGKGWSMSFIAQWDLV